MKIKSIVTFLILEICAGINEFYSSTGKLKLLLFSLLCFHNIVGKTKACQLCHIILSKYTCKKLYLAYNKHNTQTTTFK